MARFKPARVNYEDLNPRQRENYNFQKAAAVLADYGFNCIRLSDDWQGADFLAVHIDGETMLRVQLKSRISLNKKYCGKNLWLMFPVGENNRRWYLVLHDELLELLDGPFLVRNSPGWGLGKSYSRTGRTARVNKMIEPFVLEPGLA